MPRLWRGLGNLGHPGVMMPFLRYVDGDVNTFQWVTNFGPGGNKTSNEFYTIDPGAPLPLERFVLRLPPAVATDLFGEPWENYVPRQGELSASLLGEQIPTEDKGQFTHNTRYIPLDKVLSRIEGNLVAPIEITFPCSTSATCAGEFCRQWPRPLFRPSRRRADHCQAGLCRI